MCMYVSMYVCCEQTRKREPTSIDKMKSTYDGDDSGKMATCIDRNTAMKPTPVTQAPTQAVIQAGCTLVERRMIKWKAEHDKPHSKSMGLQDMVTK